MPLGRPLLFTSFLIQCWAIGGRWLIAGVGRLPRLCAVIQRRRASAHLTTAGTEIRERRGALPCTRNRAKENRYGNRNGCCVRRRGGWAFDWNLAGTCVGEGPWVGVANDGVRRSHIIRRPDLSVRPAGPRTKVRASCLILTCLAVEAVFWKA
jgi:hypothetical protein